MRKITPAEEAQIVALGKKQTMTQQQIADNVQCSRYTVRRILKKHDIPVNACELKNRVNDQMRQQIIDLGKKPSTTQKGIADKFKISVSSVGRILRAASIYKRLTAQAAMRQRQQALKIAQGTVEPVNTVEPITLPSKKVADQQWQNALANALAALRATQQATQSRQR